MNGWQADKHWADFMMPEIKNILGLYLIGEPTDDAEPSAILNASSVLRGEKSWGFSDWSSA